MGLTYADIKLSNPKEEGLKTLTVNALVDSGALYLCIPEHVANQLSLTEHDRRELTFADGRVATCPYVGPVEVNFDNRKAFVGAMVFGDEALLGAIPMEDLDLLIHPQSQELVVNPENPNMASGKVKTHRVRHQS